jgi:hypothetical protein
MNKTIPLALTAAFTFATASTIAATPARQPYSMLWNQNSNFGPGVVSDNFSSANQAYTSYGADDFVVPVGQTWGITEVDVTGAYVNGSGPAPSVSIGFWAGKRRPTSLRHSFTVSCTDNGGSFACIIPTKSHGRPGLTLKSGMWWLEVVANCDMGTCGEWEWTENTAVTGKEAVWANPQRGWGTNCTGVFEPLDYCFGGPPADFAFDLIGSP